VKEPEMTFLTLERKTSANCMMYALLKTDAEVLSKVAAGKEPPPPLLYDPERHRRHREGHYEPLKGSARRSVLTLLPHVSDQINSR
jgi:hypothetical protein